MQQSHVSSKKAVLRPRKYTVSIAIPSGILDTAPTQELKTVLAGQVSMKRRYSFIFHIDLMAILDWKTACYL